MCCEDAFTCESFYSYVSLVMTDTFLSSTVFWLGCFFLLLTVLSGGPTCCLQISLRKGSKVVTAGKSLPGKPSAAIKTLRLRILSKRINYFKLPYGSTFRKIPKTFIAQLPYLPDYKPLLFSERAMWLMLQLDFSLHFFTHQEETLQRAKSLGAKHLDISSVCCKGLGGAVFNSVQANID